MDDSLFSAPHNGTPTSKAAAESVSPTTAKTVRNAIYAYIELRGDTGATREEIENHMGIDGNTIRPRVVELINEGRVIGTDMQRKTSNGRNAEVLVVKK